MADTETSGCCIQTVILIVLSVIGILAAIRKYALGGTYHGIETMAGKTVVITGANTGIGKETVRVLASRGARIIMGCRDMTKGDNACKEIIEQTNNKNIENRKLDLSSFASVRAFAKSVLETEEKIDVLINNAGVMWGPRRTTEDGYEMQIGTNYYGHFLLNNLLLDRVKKAAPSRIVIVSSLVYKYGTINFDDINSEKEYSPYGAYSQSKLANMLHALELSKRLKGTGVTANCLHPGAVATELQRQDTWANYALLFVRHLLFKTPIQGAQTTLRLALDKSLQDVTGKYFSDCVDSLPAPHGRDEAVAKKLWEITEELTKKKD